MPKKTTKIGKGRTGHKSHNTATRCEKHALYYGAEGCWMCAEEAKDAKPPADTPQHMRCSACGKQVYGDQANCCPDGLLLAEPTSEASIMSGGSVSLGALLEQLIKDKSVLAAPAAFEILTVCMELAIMLMGKNLAYGNSALDPVRILSSADPAEQILVRMDDKLSRLKRGYAGGEDALFDFVGYWVLLRILEKRKG